MKYALWLALLLATSLTAQQELRFANVFNHHAVLQRDKPLRIWGWGKPGEQVDVLLADRAPVAVESFFGKGSASSSWGGQTQADEDGLWVIEFPAHPASEKPLRLTATSAGESVTFEDILVGEVWLNSGQSNMVWAVKADAEWGMEKESIDAPLVRYTEFGAWNKRVQKDLPGRVKWQKFVSHDKDLERVSGVSYYFALRLHRYLGVPVGIVNNAVGGSLAETWTSRPALESMPELSGFLGDYDRRLAGWEEEKQRRLAEWEARTKKAEAKGRKPPRKPRLNAPDTDRNQPAGCYNGLIAPISRLSIRGMLFLQGENNSIGKWGIYAHSFPKMIEDWRTALGDQALPFGIITLQGFGPYSGDMPAEMTMLPPGLFWYAAIRDVHLRTHQSTPHTGFINVADVGDTANIHPGLKRTVGQRAARWALAEVYGKPVIHRGPEYREMKLAGKRIRLRFEIDPVAETVIKRKKPDEIVWWLDYPISRVGKEYRGFVIAGEDRVFRPAQAKRLGRDKGWLEVWSDLVPQPVAVRYAWAGYPDANAVGHDFMPVPPFRTDSWPLYPDTPFDKAGSKAWKTELEAKRKQAKKLAEQRH